MQIPRWKWNLEQTSIKICKFNRQIYGNFSDMKNVSGLSHCCWVHVCCIRREHRCPCWHQPWPVNLDGAKQNLAPFWARSFGVIPLHRYWNAHFVALTFVNISCVTSFSNRKLLSEWIWHIKHDYQYSNSFQMIPKSDKNIFLCCSRFLVDISVIVSVVNVWYLCQPLAGHWSHFGCHIYWRWPQDNGTTTFRL